MGDAYAEPALRSIAWDGRYLVVGFAAGEIPKIPLNLALLKNCQIVGVFWGDFAPCALVVQASPICRPASDVFSPSQTKSRPAEATTRGRS